MSSNMHQGTFRRDLPSSWCRSVSTVEVCQTLESPCQRSQRTNPGIGDAAAGKQKIMKDWSQGKLHSSSVWCISYTVGLTQIKLVLILILRKAFEQRQMLPLSRNLSCSYFVVVKVELLIEKWNEKYFAFEFVSKLQCAVCLECHTAIVLLSHVTVPRVLFCQHPWEASLVPC